MSDNVQRFPTYRSEQGSERRELLPERRYVSSGLFTEGRVAFIPAGKARSAAAAIVQL
jgi:hypothetical protein